MRISKIIAGMSAMAIAAAMAVSASANTIEATQIDGKQTWGSIWADGDYVNAESFADGDCEVTVHFNWTEDGLVNAADKKSDKPFCAFKPAFANGWSALIDGGADYIQGVAIKDDLEQDEEARPVDENGDPVDVCLQNDGFIQIYNSDVTEVTFTISAACIADMKDYSTYYGNGKASTNDDGTTTDWDGFVIQTGNNGIDITSIDFSQDVKLNSEFQAEKPADESKADESKADESKADSSKADESKADSSKADSSKASTTTTTKTTTTTTGTSSAAAATSSAASDNTNTATGATAGIALAGLALAGAVAVVSKRK